MEKYILGLDISTTCTGVFVLKENGELFFKDHVDFPEECTTIYQKAKRMESWMVELSKKIGVSSIWVEDFMMGFTGGKSSAATITMLAQFNALVRYICLRVFNIEPKAINVRHARKIVIGRSEPERDKTAPKLSASAKKKAVKEMVLFWAMGMFKDFDVPKNKRENPFPYVYDEADAAVMAYYGYLSEYA